MKTRVHINIAVSDIERSVDFYSTLFGVKPSKLHDDYANFRLDQPGLHLALVKAPASAKGDCGARHYGIELFDDGDLTGWRKRLEKAKVELKVEQQVTCCYAVGNKFWAHDPDGNAWEFWVRTDEADSMHETGNAEAAGSCCTPATAGKTGCC